MGETETSTYSTQQENSTTGEASMDAYCENEVKSESYQFIPAEGPVDKTVSEAEPETLEAALVNKDEQSKIEDEPNEGPIEKPVTEEITEKSKSVELAEGFLKFRFFFLH